MRTAKTDQTGDALSDPSLRWAHMPFCWFCHEVAQILKVLLQLSTTFILAKIWFDRMFYISVAESQHVFQNSNLQIHAT